MSTMSTRLFTVIVLTRSTRLFTVTVSTRSTRPGVHAGGRITDRYSVLWKYTSEVGLLTVTVFAGSTRRR